MATTRGLTFTTTMWVIDWVHGDAADGRALALPAHAAGLAPVDVALLGVADLADGRAAARIDVADLAGRHTQLGVGADGAVGRVDVPLTVAAEPVRPHEHVIAERADGQPWELRRGPFRQRALPSVRQPGWSLLVQGVDAQHDWVAALKQSLNFIPSARLDDVMISYATDGGGVGPHFDSYDVFLLQAHGRRRWRIGPQRDLRLRDDLPLKILSHFTPEAEWVLEPGDMLYLPTDAAKPKRLQGCYVSDSEIERLVGGEKHGQRVGALAVVEAGAVLIDCGAAIVAFLDDAGSTAKPRRQHIGPAILERVPRPDSRLKSPGERVAECEDGFHVVFTPASAPVPRYRP